MIHYVLSRYYVDKLVKVFLKNGEEQFVLCHVEVPSGKGKGDLAEQMFRYFYKILLIRSPIKHAICLIQHTLLLSVDTKYGN